MPFLLGIVLNFLYAYYQFLQYSLGGICTALFDSNRSEEYQG